MSHYRVPPSRALSRNTSAQEFWQQSTTSLKASHSASADLASLRSPPTNGARKGFHPHNSEEEVKRLQKEIENIKRSHGEDLEKERETSRCLRERVGKLEGKVKRRDEEIVKYQEKLKDKERSTKAVEADYDDERKAWARDKSDLREWLELERGRVAKLKDEIELLRDENLRLKWNGATSPRALQPLQPNIPSSYNSLAPSTPRKSQSQSQPPASAPPTLSNLRKAHQHLESQHKALKAAYDEVRGKLDESTRHFRAYVKTQKEREEKRRARKEERKIRRSQGEVKPVLDRVEVPQVAEKAESHLAEEGALEPQSEAKQQISISPTSYTAKQISPTTVRLSTQERITAQPFSTHSKSTARPRTPPEEAFDSAAVTDEGRNPFFSGLDANRSVDETPSRPPMTEKPTTLHKSLVSRNLKQTPAPVTPQAAGPSSVQSEVMGSKRKLADMEGLTPAEKADVRKRLAKLPASERRDIYKEYKKGGRYLEPDQLLAQASDEYEINPNANEGAKFAFHDVKRKKEDRKHMHGGDCECCKGYYTSVGAMPKFNQGPVWQDSNEPEDEQHAMREHLNKSSRHRDTWVRAPTPPGYWDIGFPDTQRVQEHNQKADQMTREKEERIRREALYVLNLLKGCSKS
ncbi:hypothetical protein L202_07783 [Cryptococcus amylolentus CBS 6039]|uniref:DNA endonuclease activator Ctp1 C-terminal domain-containing protein n=1 Tax=Cryptococcus amylolentus CBS 6039 TaxID=1295533 RepID=A0A1E3HAP2_9TREE|nr:hypothetical protein L202_07783 [Cryptococcus amylolentus CBS 6039]ODN73225.1 hypothetical protein L202_07783 [Cryptococcus amylolentus CBS 6039]